MRRPVLQGGVARRVRCRAGVRVDRTSGRKLVENSAFTDVVSICRRAPDAAGRVAEESGAGVNGHRIGGIQDRSLAISAGADLVTLEVALPARFQLRAEQREVDLVAVGQSVERVDADACLLHRSFWKKQLAPNGTGTHIFT